MWLWYLLKRFWNLLYIITVAERDTAALGLPESRCWLPKGCPSAAAGHHGCAAKIKKIVIQFTNG